MVSEISHDPKEVPLDTSEALSDLSLPGSFFFE